MRIKKHIKPEDKFFVLDAELLTNEDSYSNLTEAKKIAMSFSEEYDDDFFVIKVIGEAVYEPPEVPVGNVRYISYK